MAVLTENNEDRPVGTQWYKHTGGEVKVRVGTWPADSLGFTSRVCSFLAMCHVFLSEVGIMTLVPHCCDKE